MFKIKKLHAFLGVTLLGTLSSLPLIAEAGGFQLEDQGVTNMGNAYAGVGAEASDATTEWYNPAGMTRIKNPQVIVSGSIIDVNGEAEIHNSTMTTSTLNRHTKVGDFTTMPVSGGNDLHPTRSGNVPAFHFVYPFMVDATPVALGFGAVVPFGLETDYPEDSSIRGLATTSAIQTVDIGPSIAIQLLKQFSIGAGVDSQYISSTFNQAAPNPLPASFPVLGPTIGSFVNEGDSWGLGWHGGLLYQPTDTTRFGLAYHSPIDQHISGRAFLSTSFDSIGLPGDFAGNFNANVTMPGYADLSGYHDINSQWAVLGSVDWTRWSSIQQLTANYSGGLSNLIPSATVPLNFRDTWRLSAGVNYKPMEKLTLRAGTAWDESPVKNDNTRTFRLPDANRIWASFGGQYVINKQFTVDAGYSHLFVKNSLINASQVVNGGLRVREPLPINIAFSSLSTATADFTNASVNEVGAQLTWNIPQV